MCKLSLLVLAGAMTLGGILIYQLRSGKSTEAVVPNLIKQEEALNDRCRDGSGDNPVIQETCAQREKVVATLKDKGWCYGRDDQAEYEKQWQRCEQGQTAQIQQQSPVSDEIVFDQNQANNKIMLLKMEAGTAVCSSNLMHGLLRRGLRSRSEILHSTVGICGQGIKRFLIMQNVPAAAADRYVESILVKVLDDVLR